MISRIYPTFSRSFVKNFYSSNKSKACINNLNFKTEFENKKPWGMMLSIDAHNCNPQTIRSKEKLIEYVNELCKLIDMKKYGPTWIEHFGQDKKVEGYSLAQFIETSLISSHLANETNSAYIDIFSCKFFDSSKATQFTADFFESNKFTHNIIFRG